MTVHVSAIVRCTVVLPSCYLSYSVEKWLHKVTMLMEQQTLSNSAVICGLCAMTKHCMYISNACSLRLPPPLPPDDKSSY